MRRREPDAMRSGTLRALMGIRQGGPLARVIHRRKGGQPHDDITRRRSDQGERHRRPRCRLAKIAVAEPRLHSERRQRPEPDARVPPLGLQTGAQADSSPNCARSSRPPLASGVRLPLARRAIRWAARACRATASPHLQQRARRARYDGQDLSGRCRDPLAARDRPARPDPLLAGGHAVEQRLRRRRHLQRQCPRLASALWTLRLHRALAAPDAGGRDHRQLFPDPEPGAVPAGDGWLRPRRHHSGARGRYGGEPALKPTSPSCPPSISPPAS